ncbi:MAG: tetratricopeptide repeat protein [bacterium]|nr:tetratricopeptide repeat protein [bacterium]
MPASLPRARRLAALLVAGVTVAVFLPAVLGNDFVAFDDDFTLLRNPDYRGLSPSHLWWMLSSTIGGHWQPFAWLTFALDWTVWGMNPVGYHLTNVLLHAAGAAVFTLVLVELLPRALGWPIAPTPLVTAAALGALAWAVHPLRVESVAWATERRDVLAGLFWLLAVLAYLRAHAPGRGIRLGVFTASVVFAALSLCAKSWAMTLFAVLLVLDAWPLHRLRAGGWMTVLAEKLPFAWLGLVSAGVTWLAVGRYLPDTEQHGLGERVAQAAYGLCFYLARTIWPRDLVAMYELRGTLSPLAWPYAGCVVAVVGFTVAAVLLRRRAPALLATWAAYAIVLAPVLGLTQAGPQLVADRYAYLATLPWFALFAGVALRAAIGAPARRRLIAVAAAVEVAVLALLTVQQSRVWASTEALWAHAVAVQPDNAFARLSLGAALLEAGRPAEAEPQFAALRAIVAANPDDGPARARLGLAEAQLGMAAKRAGRLDEAARRLEAALVLNPHDARLHLNLGSVYLELGRVDEAVRHWDDMFHLAPDDPKVRNELGGALLQIERFADAERMFAAAAEATPRDPAVWINLGVAQWQQDRRADAIASWERAVAADPSNAEAKDLLAQARAAGAAP